MRDQTREIFKDNKDVGGCKAAEKQSNTCTDSKVTISADMATFSRDLEPEVRELCVVCRGAS